MKWISNIMVFLLLFGFSREQGFAQESPNVVLINVDDLGYGDVGCYGATMVKTPNMDKLAEQGIRFTDFHSASAVCSPSRYALITGTYPARVDLFGAMFLREPLVVDTDQMTIAKVMKEAGYETAAIGKWHLGFGEERPVDWNKPLKPGPLELGFDYYFGVPVLNSHPPFVFVENHSVVGYNPDDPFVYGEQSETRWFPEKFGLSEIGGAREAHFNFDDRKVGTTLINKAIDFVKSPHEKPFFLYLATTNIHHPFTPAPRFIGTSKAGRYGDFIHELDWMLGEVLKALDEEGLTENTLVILTSDNGGMLNQGGQDAYAAGHHMNGKLLGFKFDAWEGGHRVPFIARWPGKVPAGRVSDVLASNVDLLATMANLIGQDQLVKEAQDSHNLLPAIKGETNEPIRDHLIIAANSRNHLSVRKGKWMYIPAQGGGGFGDKNVGDHTFGGPAAFPFTGQVNSDIQNGEIKKDAPPAQLYNLESDPYEAKNLYNKNPEIVKELQRLLEKTITGH
ncbi:sulfatase family protein [Maribellus mangrovi]|uniref:sulfatase family protein n=1 Tax=Maribellus mangrovi TaxID=3133146 RepID=UPI0030EDBCAD